MISKNDHEEHVYVLHLNLQIISLRTNQVLDIILARSQVSDELRVSH